jgi:hypothetical protein
VLNIGKAEFESKKRELYGKYLDKATMTAYRKWLDENI